MLRLMLSLLASAFMLAGGFSHDTATAQTIRQRIRMCWQSGAMNTPMMQMCSGFVVDTASFHSCMSGGPCLGEPPIGYSHIWTLPAGKDFVERECKWPGAVISTACKCGSCGRWP
jgi:hypothetical protein